MSLLLESCKDLMVLTEAYYGKPKEFIEIEKRLEKIIEMIRLTKEDPSRAVDINKMKEVKEIEDLFTKFFKNKETSITFYAPILSPAYNAFTFPSSLSYFKKDPNNKKLARAEDLFINVNVDIGLVYGLELTASELMSIILHEIGHCFDASIFMLLTNISLNTTIWFDKTGAITKIGVDAIGSLYNTFMGFLVGSVPLISKAYQWLNRFLSQSPILNKIVSDVQTAITDIGCLISPLAIGRLISRGPIPLVFALTSPSNMFGYGGEKFADSFATSYGYGKEVASTMHKMQQRKGLFLTNNVAKIPVLNIGYDLTQVSMRVLTLMLDPHPTEATRIQSQLNKLKRDINDPNLTPKVKKELLENIEAMEDYIEQVMLNSESDENYGRWLTMWQNYIIMKGFNGKIDPRELFEAVWEREL